MRWMALPLLAAATMSATPPPESSSVVVRAPTPLPAEYLPCTGTVPVFNPEACQGIIPPRVPVIAGDCHDRIQQVREEMGQPKLQREPASADRPLMIAAVDKRIDGCPVMQMKGDVNDLRPVPPPAKGPTGLRPAN